METTTQSLKQVSLAQKSSALKQSEEEISDQSLSEGCSFGCDISHPGWIFTERGLKECECKKQRYREKKLAQIPPAYAHIDLKTMRPQRHKLQDSIIKRLRVDPYQSLLILGPHGCGKTALAIAVYRRAVEDNRPSVFTYTPDLLDELRQSEFVEDYIPCISVDALSNNSNGAARWLLVIDDFNIGRASRFAGEAMLRILNTAYNFNHQVVITAHCTPQELKAHWNDSGEGYGGSIMRRIEESHSALSGATGALVLNFFV